MNFYALSLWLTGPLLEALILARGIQAGWFMRYRAFSAYVCCVLIQDVLFLGVYFLRFEDYGRIYWWGELFSVGLGVGVTWEIFGLILGPYPGARRMARNVLAIVIIMTLSANLANAWSGQLLSSGTVIELERNLRVMQALSLLVLAALAAYYKILIGRNAKGMFAGYGIFIGTSVITLTLRSSLGESFQRAWVSAQPVCYILALLIWTAFLWKYEPVPATDAHPRIEEDYKLLALVTRKRVLQARAFLGKATRL
jgi:hypothetical protein